MTWYCSRSGLSAASAQQTIGGDLGDRRVDCSPNGHYRRFGQSLLSGADALVRRAGSAKGLFRKWILGDGRANQILLVWADSKRN
jgi:hypothetical protein